ncbi:hypothetical protein V8E55_003930 [Tylopilus felleus]
MMNPSDQTPCTEKLLTVLWNTRPSVPGRHLHQTIIMSEDQTVLLSIEFTGRQLEHRLSAVFAGLSLTSIVFMILTGQVGRYFWKGIHNRDSPWIKGLVIFMWTVQALEFALACHVTAIAHGHDSALSVELFKEYLWEWAVYVATSVATECLVHGYFISRIYILETNEVHKISMMLCIILALEGAFGTLSILSFTSSIYKEFKLVVSFWSYPVWLGLSIFMDISIAGSMYYILKKGSPFVSTRLTLVVAKLTKFCIQTGLITGLVTGITAALWTAAQFDPRHLLMTFPLGGIYATCLMANLIARKSYFDDIPLDNNTECFEMGTSMSFASHNDVEMNGIISYEAK